MASALQYAANSAVLFPNFGADWHSEFAESVAAQQRDENAPPIPKALFTDPDLHDAVSGFDDQTDLNQFSATMMAMQEMERKRIASDLHDSIGQSLSALSCGIAAALEGTRKGNSESTGLMLEMLASQVKAAIVEVQRIAMDLRPAMLDDIGLSATLSWFLREFQCLNPGLTLKSDIDADIDAFVVSSAFRTTVFRIVQESLSNIVKHANASEIRVHLWCADGGIHLEIIDNGIGFTAGIRKSTASPSSGMGLRGMRERAACSAGRFCLVSLPDKGSRILVTWPVLA